MTNKNGQVAAHDALEQPVKCFCGLTYRTKGPLIHHLESHGVIKLAQALAKILTKQSTIKKGVPFDKASGGFA